MLTTAVCLCEDGADARACRSDKLAAWFTDFEWLSRTSADLLPWLPGKRKKVCGAAPGAAADRIRPPTVPGHQGDRPGTPGATSTASDGSDGRSGARDGNPGKGKGLTLSTRECVNCCTQKSTFPLGRLGGPQRLRYHRPDILGRHEAARPVICSPPASPAADMRLRATARPRGAPR